MSNLDSTVPLAKDGDVIREASPGTQSDLEVALLTAGRDKHYVFGLATELIAKGAELDLIGSDALDCPELRSAPKLNFLNLRGDQRSDASMLKKVLRVLVYYVRLIRYAAGAKPKVFHILWNNKFQYFDRTLLMLYYHLLGKKVILTVHNVNTETRDSRDSRLNRLTLRIQYRLTHHLFVHTEKMKKELMDGYGVPVMRITVIPYGINNAVPNTNLSPRDARMRLGIRDDEKAILFFGHIAPYKGLEYLVTAFQQLLALHDEYRLIIAGGPKNCEKYWQAIYDSIRDEVRKGHIQLRADSIPDEEIEVYFKAADVLVLPYRDIYQSGVLFLGYSFGLPALAADVGSLKDEIVEGKTGFVFAPEDPVDLARAIEHYFASDLFSELASRRREIRDYAAERNSWDAVGKLTMSVYSSLLRLQPPQEMLNKEQSDASHG